MQRILINAKQADEIRVALVDGQRLFDLDIERPGREQKKANLYKGRVTHIEPSLDAAFVEFGGNRHGFLPLKEVSPEYWSVRPNDPNDRPDAKDILRADQEILVQVDKEERGTKGAALTTYITLAGCYLVLMPNNPAAGGISRRIEGDERFEIREVMQALPIPEGMGVIIRTAGVGKNVDELAWDLEILLKQWEAIRVAAQTAPTPALIYQESDVITRTIRDYLRKDIQEIVIDDEKLFNKTRSVLEYLRPECLEKVRFYPHSDLFRKYNVESQIETAYLREVRLPSGGAIVIDHTEALVSIDINSSRATKGGDIEETAFQTNLEAADEIARQLRLRDLGGLIVIDFIDMTPMRNQREVENRLKEALKSDRARVQVGRISRFGLLEMSRQRLRPALKESAYLPCPRCAGVGTIRSVESFAVTLLRNVTDDIGRGDIGILEIQVPIDVATFLLNERRAILADLEKDQNVQIQIIPNKFMEIPQYKIQKTKGADKTRFAPSHKKLDEIETPAMAAPVSTAAPVNIEEAAVKPIVVTGAHPNLQKSGILQKFWQILFGSAKPSTPSQGSTAVTATSERRSDHSQQRHPRHRRYHRQHRSNERSTGHHAHSNRDNRDQNREQNRDQNREHHRESRRHDGQHRSRSAHSHEPRQRQNTPYDPQVELYKEFNNEEGYAAQASVPQDQQPHTQANENFDGEQRRGRRRSRHRHRHFSKSGQRKRGSPEESQGELTHTQE